MNALTIPTPVRSWTAQKLLIITVIAATLAGTAAAHPVSAKTGAAPTSFADVIERVSPAVVQITANARADRDEMQSLPRRRAPEMFRHGPGEDFMKRFFGDGPRLPTSALGSGFIIDESGIVVTNNHVVSAFDTVTVTLKDGRAFSAELVGADDKTDLAVLKIDDAGELPSVAWADSDGTRVGDWVVAVGNPFGLAGSATAGIVSARGREIGAGPYDDFIQIDAPINRGNSGGPLFNADGGVIGVNTAIFTPNGGNIGIGFAIPSNLARNVVRQLVDTGTVERGWLGVTVQPVTPEIAEGLDLPATAGALIADVRRNSPAARAGLAQGDVIVRYGDREIENSSDLAQAVAETPVGESRTLIVLRGQERASIEVQVGAMENRRADASGDIGQTLDIPELALGVAALTDARRAQLGIEDEVKGVIVTDVAPDGESARQGIRPGDVIKRVNRTPVEAPAMILSAIRSAEEDGRKTVLLLIDRNGEERFVPVVIASA